MFQQKGPKYSLETKPLPKAQGRRIVKNKEVKSTLFINLSQLPIQLNKENLHSNAPMRVESAMSRYDGNRRRLSADSNKKSLLKQKKSILPTTQQQFRLRVGQERRKYNVSCHSMIDQHQRKKSLKSKRPSLFKSKDNTFKDIRNLSVKNVIAKKCSSKLKKTNDPKNKIDKEGVKKKQSISTTAFKRNKKNKLKKEEIIYEEQDYPTNKYITDKPRKNSLDKKKTKIKKNKLTSSMCEIDKALQTPSICVINKQKCLNLVSRSSDLMDSCQITARQDDNSNKHYIRPDPIVKLNTLQYSVDIKQIRYYESVSPRPEHKPQSIIRSIQSEIVEIYPTFSQTQLRFLSSVIFIQRKWRQFTLYNKIFKKKPLCVPSQPVYQQCLPATQPTHPSPQQPDLSSHYQQSSQSCQSSINYSFLQHDIFPSIDVLLTKKTQFKNILLHQLKQLYSKYNTNSEEYISMKSKYEQQYKEAIRTLNKSKKDIKKGCLKWVESIKMKRISSESGVMGIMYNKIYKLEQNKIDSSSESSESIKKLCERLLIRKRRKMSISIVGFEEKMQIIQLKKQQSEKHIIDWYDQEYKCFRSHRESGKNNNSNKAYNENNSNHTSQNNNKQAFNIGSQQKQHQFFNKNIAKLNNYQERLSQQQIDILLQQVILSITQQFYADLLRLDQRRQKANHFHDSQQIIIKKSSNALDFHRQIYQLDFQSSPPPLSLSDLQYYLTSLTPYLAKQYSTITTRLNQNQGFTPLQYLRFLRDFQIPSDQYQPLITNEIFLQWEQVLAAQSNTKDTFKQQLATIFHRCVFQALLNSLEQHRPCGEKGLPFPWEHVLFFMREVKEKQIQGLIFKGMEQIREYDKVKCGVIQEKHGVYCEDDWEKVQQDNEGRIIDMIEKEFNKTKDEWYEVQEHSLQLKLEVTNQVFSIIIMEIIMQISA